MNKKSILISAGGTGGHIFPALSIANILRTQYSIYWIGTEYGLEQQIVPQHNIPLRTVKIHGIRNTNFKHKLLLPWFLLRSLWQSFHIILTTKPSVILGFGGYATFPICFMGYLWRIPVIIHEQNSIPGLSNKLISYFATQVLVAFAPVLKSKKTIVVGNPLRLEMLQIPPPLTRYTTRTAGLNLLIVGGSLGASILNEIMPLVCSKITNINKIVHQAGKGNIQTIQNKYSKLGIKAEVTNFIHNMAQIYTDTDLIICRSGASTVSEIASVGLAAIFIPYPHAVDNHQYYNALPLVQQNAAKIFIQDELTVDKLADCINALDREQCLMMAMNAKKLAIDNSCDKIVGIIKQYLK